MEEISINDKNKIISFIKDNDLDYKYGESVISKFHLISYDGLKFTFYNNPDGGYIITKYDKNKDIVDNPSSSPYEYYVFKTFSQALEQIAFYDKSLTKNYWYTTPNSIEIGFDKENYIDDWYTEFMSDDYYSTDVSNDYTFIVYNNGDVKPEIKSPYNTIHEVSPINNLEYTKLNSLRFEIHPISCLNGSESYLLKLSCNDEEVLKEYINYIVNSKKGLKLLTDTISKSIINKS